MTGRFGELLNEVPVQGKISWERTECEVLIQETLWMRAVLQAREVLQGREVLQRREVVKSCIP